MDKRKLEILKTDTYAMLSLAEPGQGGSVITRLDMENIEAMREVRRRYNAYPDLVAALEDLFEHCAMIHKRWGEGSNAKEAQAAEQRARALLSTLNTH